MAYPKSCYTTTEEVVLKIANALNVDISPNDIEISHKLKRKEENAIIAKFVSHKVKTKLYKERVKLKNVKLADLFPSFASATKSNHIYINKNLTNYRRHLVGIGREKKKGGVLLSVWTIDEGGKGGSRSRFTKNKMAISRFTGNGHFTIKKIPYFLLNYIQSTALFVVLTDCPLKATFLKA